MLIPAHLHPFVLSRFTHLLQYNRPSPKTKPNTSLKLNIPTSQNSNPSNSLIHLTQIKDSSTHRLSQVKPTPSFLTKYKTCALNLHVPFFSKKNKLVPSTTYLTISIPSIPSHTSPANFVSPTNPNSQTQRSFLFTVELPNLSINYQLKLKTRTTTNMLSLFPKK